MQALSQHKRTRRLRLPEKITLWRWIYPRQRYRLTREGISFVAVMALVGLAAWHSGTNLLYLVFAMLIAFFLLQGIVLWLCLLHVEARRMTPKHATAREPIQIPLLLANRKQFFASYGLRLMDYLPGKELLGACFIARLPSGSELHCHYRAVFPHRGKYSLKRLELLSRYPFGLAQRTMISEQHDQILVYPEEVDITQLLCELRIDMGEHESRLKGIGIDFYGLREYQPGETIRHVHWRSSAKAGKLMVTEYEKEESRKAAILLNNSVSAEELAQPEVIENFEKAIVVAASLLRLLARQGYELRLVTAQGASPCTSGARHMHRLLSVLSTIGLSSNGRTCQLPPDNTNAVYHVLYRNTPPPARLAKGRSVDVRNWTINGRQLLPKEPAKA